MRRSNLPPERKKALRDRDEFRRKKMAEDIQAAISESGLQLDKERREQFAKRYVEERRKIEEELRRELDEKRRAQVKEIVGRLKTEFSAGGAAAGAGASGKRDAVKVKRGQPEWTRINRMSEAVRLRLIERILAPSERRRDWYRLRLSESRNCKCIYNILIASDLY